MNQTIFPKKRNTWAAQLGYSILYRFVCSGTMSMLSNNPLKYSVIPIAVYHTIIQQLSQPGRFIIRISLLYRSSLSWILADYSMIILNQECHLITHKTHQYPTFYILLPSFSMFLYFRKNNPRPSDPSEPSARPSSKRPRTPRPPRTLQAMVTCHWAMWRNIEKHFSHAENMKRLEISWIFE